MDKTAGAGSNVGLGELMKILITGGTGLVGSALVESLATEANEIHTIGRKPATTNSINVIHSPLDIVSLEAVNDFYGLHGPFDLVIHCAAKIALDGDNRDIVDTNIIGTINLVEAAKSKGVGWFIFISSAYVVRGGRGVASDEYSPIDAKTLYHLSKVMGERIVMSGLPEKNQVLRLAAPIGPNMPPTRFISTLITRALANKNVQLTGLGRRRQDYVDVMDVADAVKQSLLLRIPGIFNIASGKSTSNVDVAHQIIRLTKSSSKIEIGTELAEDSEDWVIGVEKAQKELNFVVRRTLDQTLAELISIEMNKEE